MSGRPQQQTAVPWTRRRGAWLLGSTAALAGGLLLYRALTAVADEAAGAADKRSYVARLRAALKQYSEAFLAGAELSAHVMRDLQAFLAGDVEELPVSLRQLSRLAQSQEVLRSTSLMTAAAVRGVLRGAQTPGAAEHNSDDDWDSASEGGLADGIGSAASAVEDLSASFASAATENGSWHPSAGHPGRRRTRRRGTGAQASGMLHQVLAALTSERGSSLVTLAIGVACRSSVEALAAAQARSEAAASAAGRPDLPERLMRFAGTPEGRRFANSCVATFVREGTGAYLDRFEGMNMWDDLLAAMAKPAHTAAVDRMTRTFVREMVSSYFSPPRPSPPRGQAQRGNAAVSTACSAPHAGAEALGEAAAREACSHVGVGAASADADGVVLLADGGAQMGGSGELLPAQQAECADWADDSGSEAGRLVSGLGWASDVIQIAKAPEARAMLAALAASATAEGVRAALYGMHDLVFAPTAHVKSDGIADADADGVAAAWQQAHPLCRGYVLGSLMLLLVLYLTARHGAGQLAAPMPIGL